MKKKVKFGIFGKAEQPVQPFPRKTLSQIILIVQRYGLEQWTLSQFPAPY